MCKPGPSGHGGHSGHGPGGSGHPTELYKKPEEEGESDEEEDEDELEEDGQEAMTNLLPPTFPESLIFISTPSFPTIFVTNSLSRDLCHSSVTVVARPLSLDFSPKMPVTSDVRLSL